MKYVSLFLVMIFFTVGCTSKSEQLLNEPPITLNESELEKYWLPTQITISFNNHFIPPKVSGFVKIRYLIDSNGEIFNLVVAESEGGWDKFALRALREVHYVNTEFNFNKIPVYAIKQFNFTAP
jgi:hypothetical protein